MEIMLAIAVLMVVLVAAQAARKYCEAREHSLTEEEIQELRQENAALQMEIEWCKEYFGQHALRCSAMATKATQKNLLSLAG